jgi:predicted permease
MRTNWVRRVWYLLNRRRFERDLDREMAIHRDLMVDPRRFGNTLRLREQAGDAWGWAWLDDLVLDARFAWRTLRHSPGFTLTAVATLALGIGVNSAMFSVVNSLLLRPLYEGSGGLVGLYGRSTSPAREYRGISYPNYLDLRDGSAEIFTSLAALSTVLVGLDVGEGPRRTLASGVTANYFEIFGAPVALGRSFTVEEERPGTDARVAIVSHRLWQQRGADPGMVGRSVRINGEQFTLIGVAPEGFTGMSIPGPDVWLPLGAGAAVDANARRDGRSPDPREAHQLAVVGRLRPGTTIESAAPTVGTVARRLEQAFPAINTGYTFELSRPSRLMFMPGPGSALMTATLSVVLMIMPAIVLLVACLNLANLLLARGHVRRQELAIRSSLGGGRGRITRQLVTEGLLLALVGGGIGLWLSTWATGALQASLRPVLTIAVTLPDVDLDWRVLVGTVGFILAASLIFGAWPAWTLSGRAVVTDLKRHVGEEARQSGGLRVGSVLVIGQVALSVLLLASGGLFLMSAVAAATADPGFRLDGGVLAEVDPGLSGYNQTKARQSLLAMVDRLRTVPGVAAVTISSGSPFGGFGESRSVAPAGVVDARERSVDAVFNAIGRDYARTLGLSILGGRDFTDAELASGSTERVAIVDDALAPRLWPGESALGRMIQFLDDEGSRAGQPIRVVGIIPAIKHSLGNPHPFPHVYVPLGQHDESAMTLRLRVADGQERAMLNTVAQVIRDFDARMPVLRIETWRDRLDGSLEVWLYRAGARACSAFGGIALLLAVIGVYGVKSYVVSRRTREFGIRIATGAHPRVLLWQVMREGSRTTIVGIGIGLLLALAAGRLFQGFLYGVDAVEPIVLIAAPAVLFAASLLASYIPALRATKVDPTVARRSE